MSIATHIWTHYWALSITATTIHSCWTAILTEFSRNAWWTYALPCYFFACPTILTPTSLITSLAIGPLWTFDTTCRSYLPRWANTAFSQRVTGTWAVSARQIATRTKYSIRTFCYDSSCITCSIINNIIFNLVISFI